MPVILECEIVMLYFLSSLCGVASQALNNKYSHCYFLRDVPGLMLVIILFMFHTMEQKFDHIDQPQVSKFVCVQTAQRQRKQYGVWERMGSVLKRSSSDRLQIAFPHGRIFYKEL